MIAYTVKNITISFNIHIYKKLPEKDHLMTRLPFVGYKTSFFFTFKLMIMVRVNYLKIQGPDANSRHVADHVTRTYKLD